MDGAKRIMDLIKEVIEKHPAEEYPCRAKIRD